MFAYCGNNPVIKVDYTGMRHCAAVSIYEENAYDRLISCNHQRTRPLQKPGQIVDITEKLNGFMEENAQKLRDDTNGDLKKEKHTFTREWCCTIMIPEIPI